MRSIHQEKESDGCALARTRTVQDQYVSDQRVEDYCTRHSSRGRGTTLPTPSSSSRKNEKQENENVLRVLTMVCIAYS
jgi:hypothetical protein